MKNKIISINIFVLLLLILSSCTFIRIDINKSPSKTEEASIEKTPSITLEKDPFWRTAYSKYDSTYNPNTYYINKVTELKKRTDFIMGFDLSFVNHILEVGGKYYDLNGNESSIYKILKDNGINTVRVRLFNDYKSASGEPSGKLDLANVYDMVNKSKMAGLRVILDLHYSDYWSDPSHQYVPEAWKNLSFTEVNNNVYTYTKEVLTYFKSKNITLDYIQIGNEINNGLIWPYGEIDWTSYTTKTTGLDNVATLLKSGIKATREVSSSTKIILHTANGLQAYCCNNQYSSTGVWFFNEMKNRNVDFDIIGSSFYTFYDLDTPINELHNMINELAETIGKPVLMLETSYPYTYKDDSRVSNLFYLSSQETKGYSVTIQGQTNMLVKMIKEVAMANNNKGIGVCYWGGEWIPTNEKTLHSNWSNQALFTYEGIALPTLRVFKEVF